MKVYTKAFLDRYVWPHVDQSAGPDECWFWQGIGTSSLPMNKARLMYLAVNGEIPDSTPVLRHLCNVGKCINPVHLTLGTKKDNSHDRWKNVPKDARGKKVAYRLSQEEREPIRQFLNSKMEEDGWTQSSLAKETGVSQAYVSQVLSGGSYESLERLANNIGYSLNAATTSSVTGKPGVYVERTITLAPGPLPIQKTKGSGELTPKKGGKKNV